MDSDSCTVSLAGDDLKITIAGDFDLIVTPAYRVDVLNQLSSNAVKSIDIDLTGTTFVDSAGLSLILQIYKLGYTDICLRVLAGTQIARACELMMFHTLFKVDVAGA